MSVKHKGSASKCGAFEPTPRLPTTPGERWAIWVITLVFAGLFAAEILSNFSNQRLSILFILLWWGPMLVLHELGHAITARLLGWRVHEIVIGFGKELTRFRYGNIRIRVKALPVEGYVLPSPASIQGARWKSALIFAAGPGAEILFILLLRLFIGEAFFKPSGELGMLFWQSGAVAAGIGAGFNLVPYPTSGGASDGLGILLSFFSSEEAIRARLATPAIRQTEALLHLEQYAQAQHTAEQALQVYTGDAQLTGLVAVSLAGQGHGTEALDLLESLGHPADRPPQEHFQLLLCAAWAVLLSQDHMLLFEAQKGCERALNMSADNPKANLLLGRILLERNQPDEAYKAFMLGFSRVSDAEEETQLAAYLYIAARLTGRDPVAERFVPQLKRARIGPGLKARIDGLLTQAASR